MAEAAGLEVAAWGAVGPAAGEGLAAVVAGRARGAGR